MSLAKQSQKWFPTHVQATVLQATHLQPKGKNGTNDAYTIIQLGKEKYSTSVAEKTLNPVWKEEASFELPGLLLENNPEVYELCLTVMHRSLVGLDKFLGQKLINLNEIFANKEHRKTDWYTLVSRPGKKRKERGKIQVSIQFMRNNMTASMFDLSMRDKPRSPFSKLKEKMKGRKHDGAFSDTSSAILPRSRQSETDSLPDEHLHPHVAPETKPKRSLLAGTQKLSAAHSMSDLIGTHFRPKLDSMNSIEETGGTASHRHSQSDGYGCDPFSDIGDNMPQKYATLPHNRNPFEGDQGMIWGTEKKEKKEKVGLLGRVTGKKEGKKTGARTGSSGDLRSPNPFTTETSSETNPFLSHFKSSSDNMRNSTSKEDLIQRFKTSPEKMHGMKNSRDHEPENLQASKAAYSNLSFEEVVQELIKQKEVVRKKDAHIRELEDYIDNLLVRVMEETPSILRTPYEPKRKAGKILKK
ncbi:rab11 family-interacting protein 2-like isoform X1 [Myxocyprinus asiaticus]|uniref:rab11 family-interacting protein 2-like isoform X1 n=1 Tax=Myxocyprinus asiaticus TaxID=70543 RepID=UPI002223B828|nr:rab11 family-interacting protein 2-like isoform X1 [Myxocyprinus asiaticus]